MRCTLEQPFTLEDRLLLNETSFDWLALLYSDALGEIYRLC